MKLSQAVREYVEYKQALGMRFHTEAVMLQAFCRALERKPLSPILRKARSALISTLRDR